jgi:hypothetical protein
MGQNNLDVFIAIDRERIIAPCFVHIDGTIPLPAAPAPFTWAGVTTNAIVVNLTPRSVRSPFAFDQVRSISFGLQFNNGTLEPGDLSIWIPDTNFLHRLRPNVTNALTNAIAVTVPPAVGSSSSVIKNTFNFPSMSGQINVNAKVDSTIYLVKELDFNVDGATPPNACFCLGELALQNWFVQPVVIGGA